jgi:hypothetical protein
VELQEGIIVRKREQGTTTIYALSGRPLRRSTPFKKSWWLRGALYVLLQLC